MRPRSTGGKAEARVAGEQDRRDPVGIAVRVYFCRINLSLRVRSNR